MRSLLLIIVVLLCNNGFAQQVFTLDQAINEALQKNYSIRIERNNALVADNNNNIGNAGYLPNVTLNAGRNQSANNTRQVFFSGQINERNNAKSSANNLSVELNWTLFDGFKMFATDKRLQMEEDRSIVALNAQIEMTIYQVSALYFTIVQFQSLIPVYSENLKLSEERYALTKLQFDNGTATQVQLLQAQLDMAADKSALMQYNKEVSNLKVQMGTLLGYELSSETFFQEVIASNSKLTWDNISASANAQNSELLLAKSTIAIAEMKRKEAQSLYYPQLSFFSQYAFANSENEVGILNSSRTYGTGVGLSLTWNILDRLSTYTTNKNVVVEMETAKLQEQQIQLNVNAELKSLYNEYEWAEAMLQLEQENSVKSVEILEVAKAMYFNGAMTALELRQFQFSVIESQNRLLTAQLNYQTAELNLRLLTGDFKTVIK
ncbi:MAG: hypothetical protein RL204_2396 [Bacteroidota bacterium]|jgi:outer membrane protein TolC